MYFEQKIFSRFKRKRHFAIATVFLISFVCLGALIAIIVPQIGISVDLLWTKLPIFFKELEKQIPLFVERFNLDPNFINSLFGSWEDITTEFTKNLRELLPQAINISVNFGNALIKTLMALFASAYMLASKEQLLCQLRKVIYALFNENNATRTLQIASHSNRVFADFVVGKLLDSLIIGLMCFIGMQMIYRDYAVLISVIIGITNIIPFFGPFIGAVPSIFILLIADPLAALIFAVFILALQQFDGNFLGPRILGESTGLSPLWVLVSITVGGGLFGFIGMLVGVPTFAVIYSLVSAFVNNRVEEKRQFLNENNICLDNPINMPEPEKAKAVPQDAKKE